MATPSYNPFNTPEDNLSSLLSSQKEGGATVAKPNGAEPLGVLIAKAAFNAQQKAEQGGGGPVAWDDIENKPTAFNPSTHAATHGPEGSDTLAAYYASSNGNGLSYIIADVSANDSVANGVSLLSSYIAAKLLTPNDAPLSALNRATLILPPAVYELNDNIFLIDSDFVDVVASVAGTVNIMGSVVVNSEDAKIQGVGLFDQNGYSPAVHAPTHSPDGTDPLVGYATEGQFEALTPLTFLSDDTGAVTAYDLTATPDSWQDSNYSLTAVYGGSKLTSVGNFAFFGCSLLTSISLPAATSIGDFAFDSCGALTSVSLPAAINIGSAAFNYCEELTSISLPVATNIGNFAFQYSTSLTSISLPTATSIGGYAFSYCSSLTSEVYLNAPLSGLDAAALINSSITTIHLRPAPNTPAGWVIGPDQTIAGKEGITVVADWTTYPDLPA